MTLLQRLFSPAPKGQAPDPGAARAAAIGKVRASPLDPALHAALGQVYLDARDFVRAAAQFRMAWALGAAGRDVLAPLAEAYLGFGQPALAKDLIEGRAETEAERRALQRAGSAAEKPLTAMDHNRYYRHRTLADFIAGLGLPKDHSLLDVGGGNGEFCFFAPAIRYHIAEPSMNGIDGAALPFAEKQFDVVISCHVLEHIPPQHRETFLENLCRAARRHVVLLNPFRNPRANEEERFRLIIDLTDAQWAKEHLECSLPAVADLEQFAARKGCGFAALPNGTMAASLALVFASHYAAKAGCSAEFERVNRFYNESLRPHLDSEALPNAWLVHFDLQSAPTDNPA
ncbi:methyltransferase domain-containing protein [Candidatus Poribacteria bacterium]|nr:methyltransferase domain-containing protein [Candidatus Poribacteria bacterium]